MKTLEEMQEHYKSVKYRINNAPVKTKLLMTEKNIEKLVQKTVLDPEPIPEPTTDVVKPCFPSGFLKSYLIMKEVADIYGITVGELKGFSRKAKYVVPRQHASYLLRTRLNRSYSQIGAIMGGRDHTTIVYSVQKYIKKNKLDLIDVCKDLDVDHSMTNK